MFMCISVVGDYICLCAYMLLVNFRTCYWCGIVGVIMYWNMLVWICGSRMKYVLLLSSTKFTQLLLDFISMFGGKYFSIQLCRVFMWGDYGVFVASGATALEMKLVPHISRVGLDTLHVLGCVIFVYVLDVNYVLVYLCAW